MPFSMMRPPSRTTIRSASRTVLKRWAMTKAVRPPSRPARLSLTARSDCGVAGGPYGVDARNSIGGPRAIPSSPPRRWRLGRGDPAHRPGRGACPCGAPEPTGEVGAGRCGGRSSASRVVAARGSRRRARRPPRRMLVIRHADGAAAQCLVSARVGASRSRGVSGPEPQGGSAPEGARGAPRAAERRS